MQAERGNGVRPRPQRFAAAAAAIKSFSNLILLWNTGFDFFRLVFLYCLSIDFCADGCCCCRCSYLTPANDVKSTSWLFVKPRWISSSITPLVKKCGEATKGEKRGEVVVVVVVGINLLFRSSVHPGSITRVPGTQRPARDFLSCFNKVLALLDTRWLRCQRKGEEEEEKGGPRHQKRRRKKTVPRL